MASERVVQAMNLFMNKGQCAQAVLSAFGPSKGLSAELCVRVACAFGGGMARRQMVCGAVSGGLMVMGLVLFKDTGDLRESNRLVYEEARAFMAAFEGRNGSLQCRTLLGCDMNTEEGQKQIKEKNLYGTLCAKYVKDAVEILEEMLAGKQ